MTMSYILSQFDQNCMLRKHLEMTQDAIPIFSDFAFIMFRHRNHEGSVLEDRELSSDTSSQIMTLL